jgi:transposase
VITYITGKSVVECPFCHKTGVTAFFKPSFAQGSKSSSASAGSKTTYSRVDEKYFIQGDCPNCGAKNKDIQAWYDGQGEEKLTEEDRKKIIERMKKQGLPTEITF